MITRGSMPLYVRLVVLLTFATVAMIALVPPLVGTPIVVAETQEILDEYAPLEEDYALSAELDRRSEKAGVNMRMSPQQIAHARRTGRLDEVLEGVDEVLDERGAFETIEAPERRKSKGAFYHDEPPASAEPAGLPWTEIGLAFVGLFLFLLALGAAFVHLTDNPQEPR